MEEVSSVGSSLVLGTEVVDEVAERVRTALGSLRLRRRRAEKALLREADAEAGFSALRRRVKLRRRLPGPPEDILGRCVTSFDGNSFDDAE